jgi:hypothetical protein
MLQRRVLNVITSHAYTGINTVYQQAGYHSQEQRPGSQFLSRKEINRVLLPAPCLLRIHFYENHIQVAA